MLEDYSSNARLRLDHVTFLLYMQLYTNFGGRNYFGFGDTATLKNGQISLSDHGL